MLRRPSRYGFTQVQEWCNNLNDRLNANTNDSRAALAMTMQQIQTNHRNGVALQDSLAAVGARSIPTPMPYDTLMQLPILSNNSW